MRTGCIAWNQKFPLERTSSRSSIFSVDVYVDVHVDVERHAIISMMVLRIASAIVEYGGRK